MEARDSKKMDGSDLKEVNGGYIFDTAELCSNPNVPDRFEVINSKGDVIATAPYPGVAERIARERGESSEQLSWERLQRLRETGSPD